MGAGAALAGSTGLQVAGGLFSAGQVGAAGAAQQGYFDYLSDTAKSNAGLARTVANTRNKELNVEAGYQEKALSDKLQTTMGAQKAAVSMGAGLGSRTAQDLIHDTLRKGNFDETAIRWNTAMRSKGILDQGASESANEMTKARGYAAAGDNAMRSARISQIGSILGTGSSVASNWTRYPWAGGGGGAVPGTL